MTTILLARHGETAWNSERRWQGHADLPLNEAGREQAHVLADELTSAGVDAIYTSDLTRARQTAEIAGERLGLPVVPEPDLREIDVGSREGRTWEEIDDEPDWDGEPHEAHAERVLRALHRIARAHPGRRVLVVTHGGSMRRIHEHMGLERVPIANCSVWACALENGSLTRLD